MLMLLVILTTTALMNTILLLCIQVQLKYTIVSKVTSHAKDEGGGGGGEAKE